MRLQKIIIGKERILEITANISHLSMKQILRRENSLSVIGWQQKNGEQMFAGIDF